MTEQATLPTTTTQAAKAPKAKKATKKPASRKAAAPSQNGTGNAVLSARGKLLNPACQVLGTLAKVKTGGSLSRRAIAERVEKTDGLVGHRIANESKTYAALEEGGYVKGKQIGTAGEEINEYGYAITPKGRKTLEAAKAKK